VPDEIRIEMMSDAIKKAPPAGFILDGFPRTVNQAVALDRSLAGDGAIDAVLNLVIDDSVVEARMTGRRSCPKCGAVYHTENLKAKVRGICDHDGAKLVQRPDDTPEVVANRLETYHRQTEPLVDYYRKNSTVFDIEANEDPDEVKASVYRKLKTLVKQRSVH
jgi:adenylate kinase